MRHRHLPRPILPKSRPFLRETMKDSLPIIDALFKEAVSKALRKVAEEMNGKPIRIAERDDSRLQWAAASVYEPIREASAVEEVLGECCEAALAAGMGIGDGIVYADMEGQVRAILLTAYNLWGIGRDQANKQE